jgi:hypothetical protein
MEANAKTQAVERIKEAQNVLITVSTDPSVDQLAAAIGFTLLLNKLDKHATAVFSGSVPSTIEFLKPEETFEQNTDSLRDFIISLDKSKADKLRYKVEDDVVRIFITPYKTKITDADLIFDQGDFNVDVVVALGVNNRDHIDQAIISHGRILHDATVIGVMAGDEPVDVGAINWQDSSASSLCEMLVSISESLQSGSIDGQMATAFLTGIVANTDRFKNDKTSPKVMTMSAQLMAAGANQQLIAEQLTQPEPEPEPVVEPSDEKQNEDEGVINLHADDQPERPSIDEQAVHIDEVGKFSNSDQLREAVENVQENAQLSSSGSKKVIEPINEEEAPELPDVVDEILHPENDEPEITDPVEAEASEVLREHNEHQDDSAPKITHNRWGKEAQYVDHPPSSDVETEDANIEDEEDVPSIEASNKDNYSKYIQGPPQNLSPLNSTNAPSDEPPTVDPLSQIPQAGPINDTYVNETPLLSTQHDAESPRAIDVPSTESPLLASDGETPLGPRVAEDDTLEKIEQSVADYEQQNMANEEISEEQARQAVVEAIQQSDYDQYRQPNQNIGAQYVPLDAQPQEVDLESLQNQIPVQDPSAPPSVPPPMMPQFPLPGVEVIEPEQTK